MPLRTSERGAGTRQAPLPPGQPHLLAGRVERHRQPGQHPVAGPDRVVLQEHLRLGVDERGGVAVRDRDALRGSGRTGGEDDPRVVAAQRRRGAPAAGVAGTADQALLGDHADDVRLAEHQRGPLVGVVGVDRHIGRAGGKRRQGSPRTARSCPTACGFRCGRRDRCRGPPATRRCPRCRRSARCRSAARSRRRWRAHRGSARRSRTGCRSACAAPRRTATTGTAQELPASPRLQRTKRLPARAPAHPAWILAERNRCRLAIAHLACRRGKR